MRDIKLEQLRKMEREGRSFVEDGVSIDDFKAGVRQGKWGVGFAHAWALDAVYGPPRKQQEAAE